MKGLRLLFGTVMVMTFLLNGCMGLHQGRPEQPRTLHSGTAAMAMIFSNPDASSAVEDHPLRWVGFLLHPVGHLLDYAANRPFYNFAAQSPGLTGYTSEDHQIESLRTTLTYEKR